jgi:hypothetical protein
LIGTAATSSRSSAASLQNNPSGHPDGTEVLYQWNGLWVVGVNGSNPHQIVFGGVVRGYSWEPVN